MSILELKQELDSIKLKLINNQLGLIEQQELEVALVIIQEELIKKLLK